MRERKDCARISELGGTAKVLDFQDDALDRYQMHAESRSSSRSDGSSGSKEGQEHSASGGNDSHQPLKSSGKQL